MNMISITEQQRTKDCIYNLFEQSGFNKRNLHVTKEYDKYDREISIDEFLLHFTHKSIVYEILIEESGEVHFGIKQIEGIKPDDYYFDGSRDSGLLENLKIFFYRIKKGDYAIYKKAWDDVEKLREKYEDNQVGFLWEDLLTQLR